MKKASMYLRSLLLAAPCLYIGEVLAQQTCKTGKINQVYIGKLNGKTFTQQLSSPPTDDINEVYIGFDGENKLYRLNGMMNINDIVGHAFVSALMLAGQIKSVVTIKDQTIPNDCKEWDELIIQFVTQ